MRARLGFGSFAWLAPLALVMCSSRTPVRACGETSGGSSGVGERLERPNADLASLVPASPVAKWLASAETTRAIALTPDETRRSAFFFSRDARS